MGSGLKINDTALGVCQEIVRQHSKIAKVKFYSWVWGTEFSLKYKTEEEKRKHVRDAVRTNSYIAEKEYSRKELLALHQSDIPVSQPNQAWGICSRVICEDGSAMQIPMMDADPEKVSLNNVIELLKLISDKPAILVKSGRGIHYYGNYLLTEKEWLGFLANFLLLDELNTSRYIGHCLHREFCTLRLTGGADVKKEIPKVIAILNP